MLTIQYDYIGYVPPQDRGKKYVDIDSITANQKRCVVDSLYAFNCIACKLDMDPIRKVKPPFPEREPELSCGELIYHWRQHGGRDVVS